jgi:hypothetical protein
VLEAETCGRIGEDLLAIVHRPGLLDDPTLLRELATTASLALQHERLHAARSWRSCAPPARASSPRPTRAAAHSSAAFTTALSNASSRSRSQSS